MKANKADLVPLASAIRAPGSIHFSKRRLVEFIGTRVASLEAELAAELAAEEEENSLDA